MKAHLSGLYVITDNKLIERENLVDTVESALKGGADMIQLREKNTNAEEILSRGGKLLRIAKKYHVPLIINDYPEMAYQIGADGVHLGKNDPNIKTARKILGNNKIIGVSCYNQIDHGANAVRDGADYIVFGTPYFTPTKPEREPTPIETLFEARDTFRDIPIFAIGGITPENASEILKTGVDGIVVITAVFGQKNTKEATQQLKRVYKQIKPSKPNEC